MTIIEALEKPYCYPRHEHWPEGWHLREWEEHLWLYVPVGGCTGERCAPWSPTRHDLQSNDWEWFDP